MRKAMISISVGLVLIGLCAEPLAACTSYLITKGATKDGSTMITYVADSHIRYGELYYSPGGPQVKGSFYQCYDRGSHKPLARIPNPPLTYTVIGYMNEKQVAIGETTFGGRKELDDKNGLIDYGSLMFLAMQRARTAREAISVIVDLVDTYGYFGAGESFSIADPNEAWIMEIVGKGSNKNNKLNKGALWVAIRIPDGTVSAHANQARITHFPKENGKTSISSHNMKRFGDPDIEVVYAHDVISFARDKGFYKGSDEEFSFSDVYAPVDFGGARFCESRVWSMFKKVNSEMDQYEAYAMGKDLSRRMPLYVRPDRKLAVEDIIAFKRDYLQGTEYDMSRDIGAGPYGLPYRWRPLSWKYEGKTYFHERTTATQQTAFSYVAQLRNFLPDPIGGISWFGVDDTNTTVYIPMYAGMSKAPDTFAQGNGNILEYSDTSAFWAFNQLAHFAYLKYNTVLPDIQKIQKELETRMRDFSGAVDQAAYALYQKDPDKAKAFLTDFSVKMADDTVSKWKQLYRFLLVKYLDGNVKKEENGEFLLNEFNKYPQVEHPDLPDWWKKLIIKETGDKFLTPQTPH